MKPEILNCSTCVFSFTAGVGESICRRYPPAVEITEIKAGGEVSTRSFFPPIAPDVMWCGEHTPRPRPQAVA